jgi:hypothetical protein
MTTLPPATAGPGYFAISELELVPRLRDFSILNLPSLAGSARRGETMVREPPEAQISGGKATLPTR